jgi:hypothetical protein
MHACTRTERTFRSRSSRKARIPRWWSSRQRTRNLTDTNLCKFHPGKFHTARNLCLLRSKIRHTRHHSKYFLHRRKIYNSPPSTPRTRHNIHPLDNRARQNTRRRNKTCQGTLARTRLLCTFDKLCNSSSRSTLDHSCSNLDNFRQSSFGRDRTLHANRNNCLCTGRCSMTGLPCMWMYNSRHGTLHKDRMEFRKCLVRSKVYPRKALRNRIDLGIFRHTRPLRIADIWCNICLRSTLPLKHTC